MSQIIPIERIHQRIFLLRGDKIMLDRDLAELYQVPTKVLNQAVRRNIERFPSGFMFQLTKKERIELVTNCDRFESLKHSSSYPLAFTEQGVAMLSSVLKSKRAIQVNIQIMKTFVHLRKVMLSHAALSQRLDELEKKYDEQFKTVFQALRQIIYPPAPSKRQIGFQIKESLARYQVKKKSTKK